MTALTAKTQYKITYATNTFRTRVYPIHKRYKYTLASFDYCCMLMSLMASIERRGADHQETGDYLKNNILNAGYSENQYNRFITWLVSEGLFMACSSGYMNRQRLYPTPKAISIYATAFTTKLPPMGDKEADKRVVYADLMQWYFKADIVTKKRMAEVTGWSLRGMTYCPSWYDYSLVDITDQIDPATGKSDIAPQAKVILLIDSLFRYTPIDLYIPLVTASNEAVYNPDPNADMWIDPPNN